MLGLLSLFFLPMISIPGVFLRDQTPSGKGLISIHPPQQPLTDTGMEFSLHVFRVWDLWAPGCLPSTSKWAFHLLKAWHSRLVCPFCASRIFSGAEKSQNKTSVSINNRSLQQQQQQNHHGRRVTEVRLQLIKIFINKCFKTGRMLEPQSTEDTG